MAKKKQYTEITSRGGCGFAQSGRLTYLLNSNKKKSFRVQIRAYFKYEGGRQGHTDNTYVVPPKSEVSLGCSCVGDSKETLTRYTFAIMNETEMR